MVKALFDTNILIDYLGGIAQARDELARYRESAISVISWMEVMVGARPEVELATRRFLSQFSIVAVDRPVAERAVLIRRGRRIRLPDAIIQASSEVHAMLLVTRNTRDFDAASPSVRVPYAL
ncbi:MAG TPA: type II toxin-antitoxin system VapC family toxin [Amaricoccus sp.]|jgi:predicted nucleic acid-binding protein|nr:type II toxin-antitoxin system VapC family toxin [Amaricoccus sp.]